MKKLKIFLEIKALPRWVSDFYKLKIFLEAEALPKWVSDFQKLKTFLEIEPLPRWILDCLEIENIFRKRSPNKVDFVFFTDNIGQISPVNIIAMIS